MTKDNSLKPILEQVGVIFSDSFSCGSSYLLEDGLFVNLDQQTTPMGYHGAFDNFLSGKGVSTQEYVRKSLNVHPRPFFMAPSNVRVLRFTDNAVVLNDGMRYSGDNNFIDLPPVKPQGRQLEQLVTYIDNLHYGRKDKTRLDVSLDTAVLTFDLNQDSTDDIIKQIDRLYNQEQQKCIF